MGRRALGAAVLGASLLAAAHASETKFWTASSYDDFFAGESSGVSLLREGSISVAPALEEVFKTDDAMVWATARDSKGNVYLGTGHSGKVYKLSLGSDGKWKGEQIYDASEPDIFALAVDKNDRLYVGTSPDGKIYRLESNGQAKEFFDPQKVEPKTKYIWAMAFGGDGALYVGTGDRGRIFRVEPDGKGAVYFETNQTHVMTLAVRPAGVGASSGASELLAGSEPNGLLYKITAANKAQVIYDSPLSEIHQIAPAADGSLYIATLGASTGTRQRPAAPATAAAGGPQLIASTTITVRADDPGDSPSPGGQPDQPQVQVQQSEAVPRLSTPLPRSQGGGAGQNRSAVVKLAADGTTQTLWESTTENAFDLLPSAGRLQFSTDEEGRIYEISAADHELRLVNETEQEQTTRLVPVTGKDGDSVLATTANLGKVFRMARQPAASGTFESEVKDAGNLAAWGQIRWKALTPAGTAVELATRTGNSAKPDATWSEWSAGYASAAGQTITSPAAKYIQWKATLRTAGGLSPVLQEVTVAYLPHNRAPEISELKITPRTGTGNGQSAGGAQRGVHITGTQTGGQAAQPRGVDISWLASDADQDELSYNLYFRGEAEREWKLIEKDLHQNYYQLGPNSLPDGTYRLRVVASDAAGNARAAARSDERISEPFLVDFTAPQIEVLGVDRSGAKATVRWKASDAASYLTKAELALDAEDAGPASPADGIVDSREETFSSEFDGLTPQEHLVTLRATDAAGNSGSGKAVLPPATGN